MKPQPGRTRDMDTYVDNFFDTVFIDIQDGSGDDSIRMREYECMVEREKFEALKDRYYRLAGWDEKTGWPTRETLEKLDLKNVADGLEAIGKLP